MPHRVGTLIGPSVVRVEAQRIKTISALADDPTPLHYDREYVARLGLGDRPINQGPATTSYLIDLVVDWMATAADDLMLARCTTAYIGAVRADDRVRCAGRITDVAPDGGVVVELEATVAGRRVATATATWVPRAR